MSAREPSPWDVATGAVAPPPWQGPAQVHRLLSAGDAQPEEPAAQPESARTATQTIRCRGECQQDLPATSEFFYRSKRYASGFLNLCKPCYAVHPSIVAKRTRKLQRAAANQHNDLQQLTGRATTAILEALPPWTLIEPDSPREELLRKVPAALWWQLAPKSYPESETT